MHRQTLCDGLCVVLLIKPNPARPELVLQKESNMRTLYWKIKCWFGYHRLYETVGNFGTGLPSTGYKCYECKKKWDWEGNARLADGTGY